MSQILNLTTGVSTIGNSTNIDVTLSNIDTDGIVSLKTLVNGKWVSWTKGTPDNFQGFYDIKKGLGYVIKLNVDKTIELTGEPLNINDITITNGLALLAIPFTNRNISGGYLPRFKTNSLKTMDAGVWKSWTEGAPDGFQGFTTVNNDKGYVTTIDSTNSFFLDTTIPNETVGVKLASGDTALIDDTVVGGIRYTNPYTLGNITFDIVTFDETTPTMIMFLSLDGKIAKLDFPIEYLGKTFFIDYNGVKYIAEFTENEDYSTPTLISEILDTHVELMFDKELDIVSTNINTMKIKLDTNIYTVIEFADEYLGKAFKIWKDNGIGSGVFAAGSLDLTI